MIQTSDLFHSHIRRFFCQFVIAHPFYNLKSLSLIPNFFNIFLLIDFFFIGGTYRVDKDDNTTFGKLIKEVSIILGVM